MHTEYPEIDGGSPVTECELLVRGGVSLENGDESGERTAYRGKDTECTVNALVPGQKYVFLVRASNRVGVSLLICIAKCKSLLFVCFPWTLCCSMCSDYHTFLNGT